MKTLTEDDKANIIQAAEKFIRANEEYNESLSKNFSSKITEYLRVEQSNAEAKLITCILKTQRKE